MKKYKKVRKIVEVVIKKMRDDSDPIYTSPVCKMYTGDWAEYDFEVSEKLKKMLLNLLDYKNNIKINISENSLSISVDSLSDIKKSINVNKVLINDDDYFSVDIIKETGFTINRGYSMRSQYLDTKIYDEILPVASNKLKKINSENFSDIWNNVMKESGLMRDNNIDELLKKLDV
jgi:hypothetical protein